VDPVVASKTPMMVKQSTRARDNFDCLGTTYLLEQLRNWIHAGARVRDADLDPDWDWHNCSGKHLRTTRSA
jgi:hypothetical protein